jgi:hypothetical protein
LRSLLRLISAVGVAALALTMAACSSPEPVDAFDPGELTADEQATVEANLAEWAETYGISDPPDVEIVRFVSSSEWSATMVNCLQRQGYDAQLGNGGSFQVEFGPGQAEAGDLDQYECAAQYPVRPDQTGPLNDEQKDATFQYLTVDLVECLAAEGYETTDVPSEATFMDGFDQSPPWNPYAQIYSSSITREDLQALESACPVNTPAEVLYGS